MKIDEKYILGTKINHKLSYSSTVAILDEHIRTKTAGIVCTTNPEFIMTAQTDHTFKDIINSSLLSLPDGFGVLIASEYLDYIEKKAVGSILSKAFLWIYFCFKCFFFPNRCSSTVTGVDLVTELCKLAAARGYSIFFLGGRPRNVLGHAKHTIQYDIASRTAQEMKERFPDLKVIGATSQFNSAPSDDIPSIEYISQCMSNSNVSTIDIILVAYNFAAQEKWLLRNMDKINATVGIGVGGSFDYLSGYVSRPPIIVRRLHLEWLYRSLIHPFRAKRMFNALVKFSIAIISYRK